MSSSLQSEEGEFWKTLWTDGSTDWHSNDVQNVLKANISFLQSVSSSAADEQRTIFVPLCGKSVDMLWLSDKGFSVAGCDISELAVEQFFTDNSIPYDKSFSEHFVVFKATDGRRHIELYAGDIYNCTPDTVGGKQFDTIWDCNALVAVNPEDRTKYSDTLLNLLKPKGRLLLNTYEYDQSLRSAFPHSISSAIIQSLFESQCTVSLAASIDMKASSDVREKYFLSNFKLPWANRLITHIEKKGNDM